MKSIDELPQVISAFITAANKPDPAAFVDCFAENAVVTDEEHDRTGKEAIKKWSDENHFAYNVKLEPSTVKEEGGVIIVTCKIDGDYDKTGLPDPLFLDFKFRIHNDKIIGLVIE